MAKQQKIYIFLYNKIKNSATFDHFRLEKNI